MPYNPKPISKEELEEIIDRVLAENQGVIEELKKGKNKALGFLMGQVMKLTSGKANPVLANKILKKKL